MSKTNKTTKLETVMELTEKVDFDVLTRLLNAEGLDEITRKQLKRYHHKKNNDIIPVKYHFSKNLMEKGRLYAEESLSLQNFKKEIRHALASKYYIDIDMENCHPRLIMQYCVKNNIDHDLLKKYVDQRDQILLRVAELHKIDRNQAKKLILRLCYLGNYIIEEIDDETGDIEEKEPKIKDKFLVKFQKQLRDIASSVCDIERDTFDLISKNETKTNKSAATLSITAQVLEHKCLMAMYDYFTKQKYKVGVLCFDGLMVEKNEKLEKNLKKYLESCERHVKNKTKYEIILSTKEMDSKLTIKLPKFSGFVESDRDCQEKLFKIEGSHKFKYVCLSDDDKDAKLYIYNEKTGMYDTDINTLYYYLVKNREYFNIVGSVNKKSGEEKTDNYGDSSKLQKQIVSFVKMAARDDEWLSKTQKSSLGYLLFKDGIYDMKNSTFTKGFDPNIVFHARVPWNFPKYDKKEIKNAYKISFKNLFENPKPMIAALARALAGDVSIKKFYFCPGRTNAGKSYLGSMLHSAFGSYIGNFNAESLAYSSNMDSKDEAQKNRWALLKRWCRILLSNEVNMSKELNANDIKKHSSGKDPIQARGHGKNEIDMHPQYTIFCMLNDIPKITPLDEATIKRLTYIEFPYVFVPPEDKDKKEYYKQMDPDLDNKISKKTFIDAFIHIILDGYKDYLENGMPEFDQIVKDKWLAESKQKDEITNIIKENYEITGDDKDTVTVSELNNFKKMNKNIFSKISAHRFNEILCEKLHLKEDRNNTSRFWRGIKKRSHDLF